MKTKNSFTAPLSRKEILFLSMVGIFGICLAVVFDKPEIESQLEQQTAVVQQPVPTATVTPPQSAHYFDYTKIVSTIGLAFKERQTTESGEVWMNSSATSVTLIGAPNAVKKVSVMMQGNGDDEEQKFNDYLLHDLATILVGDSDAVLYFANQVKMDTKETRIINGISVLVAKVSLNQLKNSATFYTFTFPD